MIKVMRKAEKQSLEAEVRTRQQVLTIIDKGRPSTHEHKIVALEDDKVPTWVREAMPSGAEGKRIFNCLRCHVYVAARVEW